MRTRRTPTLLALAIAGASSLAHATDTDALSPWTLRVGPANVSVSVDVDVAIAGTPVPGGSISVPDKQVAAAEIRYALTPKWTARFVVAQLPTATAKVDGSLSGMVPPLTGTLGRVTYAPLALTATYQLADWPDVKPYVGAGAAYTRMHKIRDGDLATLAVDDSAGPVLQAGVDVALDKRWALFVDLRKLWIKTTATGTVPAFGGVPAVATGTVAPMVVHLGVGYRF